MPTKQLTPYEAQRVMLRGRLARLKSLRLYYRDELAPEGDKLLARAEAATEADIAAWSQLAPDYIRGYGGAGHRPREAAGDGNG